MPGHLLLGSARGNGSHGAPGAKGTVARATKGKGRAVGARARATGAEAKARSMFRSSPAFASVASRLPHSTRASISVHTITVGRIAGAVPAAADGISATARRLMAPRALRITAGRNTCFERDGVISGGLRWGSEVVCGIFYFTGLIVVDRECVEWIRNGIGVFLHVQQCWKY